MEGDPTEGQDEPAEEVECDCEEGAPKWVVTFGDLMSLLLTFFVLLLSFSRMDQERFKELAGSLKEAFGVQRQIRAFDLPKGIDMVARDFNQQLSADILLQKLKSTVKRVKAKLKRQTEPDRDPDLGDLDGQEGEPGEEDEPADGEMAISVEEGAGGIIIRLSGAVLFDSGKAELRELGRMVLAELAPVLQIAPGEIGVEGHTDSRPFGGRDPGLDDGNWELSYRRARAVVAFLNAEADVDLARLALTARGPSLPLDTNETEEGRARNRRVELVMMKPLMLEDPEPARGAAGEPGTDGKEEGTRNAPAIPESLFSPTESTSRFLNPMPLFPD